MNDVKELKEQIGTARKEIDSLRKQKQNLVNQTSQINDDLPKEEWNNKFEAIKGEIDKVNAKIKIQNEVVEDSFDQLKDLTEDMSIATEFDESMFGIGKNGQTGGRALDGSGSIKLYSPDQSIAADHSAPRGEQEVDLGSYLRAVVQGPRNQIERDVIQNSVTSDGYELPVHIGSELIDRLRAVNPLLMDGGAGARTITLDGGETKFVKTDSDPDAVWHAELVEETPSDPTFSPVTMDPKTVLALTEIGRETLQDSENVAEALTNSFVGSLNDAILTATFSGGGGSDEPEGLSSVITQTEEYANGGTPDWSHFVKACRQLHDNNVPNGNRSFVHAPDIWEAMALITDDNGRYQDAPSFIRDISNYTTSGVTDGQAYTGDFSNVVYGFRLSITIEQFRGGSAAKKYGSIWVAAARLDIATFRPSALVRIEEASA